MCDCSTTGGAGGVSSVAGCRLLQWLPQEISQVELEMWLSIALAVHLAEPFALQPL